MSILFGKYMHSVFRHTFMCSSLSPTEKRQGHGQQDGRYPRHFAQKFNQLYLFNSYIVCACFSLRLCQLTVGCTQRLNPLWFDLPPPLVTAIPNGPQKHSNQQVFLHICI